MSTLFPAIDPIPLPAPVWLFKVLHNLTLALHFSFLSLLIGGLVLAMIWNFFGHLFNNKTAIFASGVVVNRLPIVTTYVINLGIPPLLFVQVLYGRAIYTSTILIGAYWISVVFAVMAAYFVLYRMATLSEKSKAWWGWGIIALALLGHVGHVYSTASTLMLRPEVWPAMYDATVSGTHWPPADPTLWPRFAMVIVGALAFGSLGSSFYTSKASLSEEVKSFIRFWAGLMGSLALLGLSAVGCWAFQTQPEFVQQGLQASGLGHALLYIWPVCVSLSLVAALSLMVFPKSWSWSRILLIFLPAFLAIASFEILRDLVRDIALVRAGFDVWASPVNTNWLVVGLFLLLFVVGLGFLTWVLLVMRRAKPSEERYV
jgi:hypothetical protein